MRANSRTIGFLKGSTMAKNRGKKGKKKKPSRAKRKAHAMPVMEATLRMWEHYWRTTAEIRKLWGPLGRRMNELKAHGGYDVGLFPYVAYGALMNWSRLRDYLLNLHQKDPSLSHIAEFDWPEAQAEEGERDSKSLASLKTLPLEYASWTRYSRRVYRVPADLQAVLSATDFGELNWGDVEFPHESFAVELATPLPIHEGRSARVLLLSKVNIGGADGERLIMRAFSDKPEHFEAAGPEFYAGLREAKTVDQKVIYLQQETERVQSWGLVFVVPLGAHDSSIQETLSAIPAQTQVNGGRLQLANADLALTNSSADALARILVGVALHFQSTPNKDAAETTWNAFPGAEKHDPAAVTSGAQLFEIQCDYELSEAERIGLGLTQASDEERAAFAQGWKLVRGYWRRRPGYGRDPNAKKTVRVNPFMRRKDLMPESGVPQGTKQGL